MDSYLLDTNILFAMVGERREYHDSVWNHRSRCGAGTALYISAVTLGEFDLGICLAGRQRSTARKDIADFMGNNGIQILSISKHTAECYGALKGRLVERYRSGTIRNRVKFPESWIDPESGSAIGIDECDLWICANALERNLVLVTHDQMSRLRDVITELRVEDWTLR